MLCIGSGKGGVGKSSLTVNLAAALAAEGKKVGVLDADVWGYSIPRMLGLGAERPKVSAERKILPLEAHGLKVMSIGFFLDEDEAVVWRGPMLHKALTQFLEDVAWGELDHLLIDLPPGTGDVSMTLASLLPQAKFVIVTTPQPTAQKVARRSAEMADKVKLEIARRDREHVRLHDARRASASSSSARAAASRWPTRSTSRCWARCRSRCRCARAPTAASRCSSPTRTTRRRRRSARPRAGIIAMSPIELPVLQAPAPGRRRRSRSV